MKHKIKKTLNKVFSNQGKTLFNSANYWDQRYLNSGTSGSGSYGKLALFKAEILNNFCCNNKINNVIELGSGDGNQLQYLKFKNYIGFDVSKEALNICSKKFNEETGKKFIEYKYVSQYFKKADLALSLDVIYHLIEDDVYEKYMRNLFAVSKSFVIIYSSNFNKRLANHVKCREFTKWIDENLNFEWELVETIKNRYPYDIKNPNKTSMSDFYIYKNKLK